jgi:hypothetical protein
LMVFLLLHILFSVFVVVFLFFWQLHCLHFDIQLLITPLVSSDLVINLCFSCLLLSHHGEVIVMWDHSKCKYLSRDSECNEQTRIIVHYFKT